MRFALALAAMLAASAAGAAGVVFPEGKACVAWKVRKTMFLFRTIEPVGMNCAVRAVVVNDGGLRRLRVSVPIAAFDSGAPRRDKEVLQILKADIQPEIEFLSRSYMPGEWESLRGEGGKTIEGELRIGRTRYPIAAPFAIVGEGPDAAAAGLILTSFSAFSITPPTVGGGLVAQVADYLEFHYRVPLSDVLPR